MIALEKGDDAGVRGGAWFAIIVLLALTIISYLDRSILALMVAPIQRDLHIDDFQMSLLQGLAFALFYIVVSVPMGWISDHVSRKLVIFSGASFWSIATVACGLAGNFMQLFAARLAVGAGEATLSPAAYALTADLFPPRRLGFAIGILAAGAAIGSALALIIGGLVVAWAESVPPVFGLRSWQLVFIIVGLPGLLVAPLIFLTPGTKRIIVAGGTPVDARAYGRWLRARRGYILPLSIGIGCQAAVAYGASSWTPSYLQRHFGYDIASVGLLLGIVQGGGGIIGFIGGGWLVDRLSAMGVRSAHSTYLTVSATLTCLVGAVAFSMVSWPPLLFALIALLHMLFPFTGPAIAQVQGFTPRIYRARTVAIIMLIFNFLGMVLGPSSVALLTTYVAGGPAQVGMGITLTFLIFGPVAALCLWLAGRAANRLRDEDARAADAAPTSAGLLAEPTTAGAA